MAFAFVRAPRRPRRFPALALLLVLPLLACLTSSSAGAASGPPSHPLVTAVVDPFTFGGPDTALAFSRSRGAGASAVRLILNWRAVAPSGETPPPGFDPTNPADPAYKWDRIDALVKLAVADGLDPILSVENAPLWAQDLTVPDAVGNWYVDSDQYGKFALAAARRYAGNFQGLPRIRYWQAWNEPNLSSDFNPQLRSQLTKTPTYPFDPADVVSPDLYRGLVNAFAASIHEVHPDNLVIAGGTSPFSGTRGVVAIGPLLFMQKVLCMSNDPVAPKPTCGDTVHFDVWSTHPYTAGGPTDSAGLPEDVSLGDLPKVRTLLTAAASAGHVISSGPVRFWVTEFGWDTSPPDCCAVPPDLHARWVAEALYRMWLSGVTLATWLEIRDDAANGRPDWQVAQSGLYFRGATIAADRPKPALSAFRFPFVAYRSGKGVYVWGRTPWGKPGQVLVEQSVPKGWKLLTRLTAGRYGIFSATLRPAGNGLLLRARLPNRGWASRPFSLQVPPDLKVNPFGGTFVPCNTCPP